MELSYDWKNFQSLFYIKRTLSSTATFGPIYLVTDGRMIVSVLSEGEDLNDWIGSTTDEMVAELGHREVIQFDREKVDEWMDHASGLEHFYDQIQYLRNDSQPQWVTKNKLKQNSFWMHEHFLLFAVRSWWSQLVPSTYGIYIRLDEGRGLSLFLIVQRGRVQSFHVPDLSSMIPDRRKYPSDIVKYLSGHYLVPVQGLFLSTKEWFEWSEMAHPWPKIAAAVHSQHNKLVPFNWGLAFLIATRSYFGI